MRDQFAALIAVRFVLLKNTMTAGKAASVVIGAIMAVLAFLVSIGISVALVVTAGQVEADQAWTLLVLGDVAIVVFLGFWSMALLMELQRSEVIDFRKMLYLPVSMRMVFVMNYVASLFSFALIMFIVPTLALCGALAWNLGPRMLLAIPLAVLFYLALASWTYYVRGVLSALMENKKRRRLVLTILPMIFVLLFQLPNILQHTVWKPQREAARAAEKALAESGVSEEEQGRIRGERRAERQQRTEARLRWGNIVVPFGWLPYGVCALAEGRAAGVAAPVVGLGILMFIGLALGYRSTYRYYAGVNSAAGAKPERGTASSALRKPPWTEWKLPFFDDDTSAMAMSSLLSYLRQPNIYMMLFMPIVFGLICLVIYKPGDAGSASLVRNSLVPFLVTVWPAMNFGMLLFNVFGVDPEGFRALVLLPTERRKYLLGKNAALFPLMAGLSFALLVLSVLVTKPPPAAVFMACMHVVQLFLLFSVVGNLVSAYFPYRMAWSGLKTTTNRAMTLFGALVSLVLVLLLMLPTAGCMFVDPFMRWRYGYQGLPVGSLLSAASLTLSVFLYRWSLGPAGALLRKREQLILDKLVRDTE
ncbi:MAG: hypothetical protein GWP08_00800 [Nitrospiraceae bacterium]|nr:hypothetical protein [Nitrospiraceae bacterium]